MSIKRLLTYLVGFWFLLNCVIFAAIFVYIMYVANISGRSVAINFPQIRMTLDEFLMSLEESGNYKLAYNKKLDKCELHSS